MTRSSTKELFSPLENPKQKYRSKRRHFDTPSLIKTNSPEFDQILDIEEQSEEEVRETMTKTMEQYMSKTRGDYGSGVTRPAIKEDTQFELKGWLRNQPSGSITTWEVNKKVYAAQVGCELCKGPHYTKYYPQKEEGKILEEAYYTQFGSPYQLGGQYRAARLGFYQRNNGNSSYPDRRPILEESLTKFMAESAKRHKENSNIIKEIRTSTDTTIRNQGASIKTLEIQIGQMSKVLQERGFGSLPSSMKTNPKDQVKLISTTKADFSKIRRIGCGPYAISGTQHRSIISKIVPFLKRLQNFDCDDWREAPFVDLGASMSVMPFSTYTNLGLRILSHTRLTIELANRTIKQPKGIAENVLVMIRKFVFPIDFIIFDIPEDNDVPLILGRPFLPSTHSKIDA
nr:hypothetical protein [Tanacetum cinerariifolium]